MSESKFSTYTGITFKHFKNDSLSSIVVFLVAMPLCLGIALASGAPLFSGLVTGIVGGIVVALLSGSQLAVSGPAAGLAVIVYDAIADIGFFEGFLVAVVLAGVIQLLLGFLKAGTIGNYFPSSVIKGMLAAIGILLIIKQIPHVFGYDEDYLGDLDFWQNNDENALTALVSAFQNIEFTAFIISVISLIILIGWSYIKNNTIKSIPAPLVVVFVGVGINALFIAMGNGMALSQEHLVTIPVLGENTSFEELFVFPDWSVLSNPTIYTVAITIAIVASLETLLSVEAVDKLDPQKRRTPLNKELKAQGIGNILAGLIGGLPMTAVIVRGTVNINSGAKTKLSAFLHGVLLIVAILIIPTILNMIPYASLAAILLFTGYKLANVNLMKEMYKVGPTQFYPFVITIVAIVFTDLLVGIIIGLLAGFLNILLKNMKNTYSFDKESHKEGEPIRLVLSDEVSFLNKASMVKTLDQIPENAKVIIDARKSKFIDFDVIEAIELFTNEGAQYKNIEVELLGFDEFHKKYSFK
ncbi:Sulfate permease, MFS superfamily [Marivirga sericea]|uniref:Sulfate permease, MFS superfamily n=1 Tax=Marivirga sericea TaxID=1028 RepID=A0A1X7JHL0_9BACT|nr:SulP family inorganic anion transporter [Marivirga sericea]SMG27555.1 Sulfate permease, MFS superfamily [Marivirga sericea]